MATTSERYLRGMKQLGAVDGEVGVAVVQALAGSFPDFAAYVLEFPFGDIYARPGLGLREREIATVAALCAMGTAGPQLRVHLHAALHVGCTPKELVEVLMQMSVYAGFPAALNGLAAAKEVFAQAGIALPVD
jgi:4-carboxymuconolactone decarboxylase